MIRKDRRRDGTRDKRRGANGDTGGGEVVIRRVYDRKTHCGCRRWYGIIKKAGSHGKV